MNLLSPAQPQLDWLYRAKDVDGLIALHEEKIDLLRQMTTRPDCCCKPATEIEKAALAKWIMDRRQEKYGPD